ncbi:hypothetical protein VPHD148_0066 [Vibrio phage D148]
MKSIRILIGLVGVLFSVNALAINDDKQKHLVVSTAIGAFTQIHTEDWKTSMAACTAVGLAKELYDEYDYGGFDGKDLAYDVAGCAVGVAVGDTALKVWHQDNTVGIQYNWEF